MNNKIQNQINFKIEFRSKQDDWACICILKVSCMNVAIFLGLKNRELSREACMDADKSWQSCSEGFHGGINNQLLFRIRVEDVKVVNVIAGYA